MPGQANARDARRKRRTDAAIVREDFALTLYASGFGWAEMTKSMRDEFGGSFVEATLRKIVYRGLARRAAEAPEEVAVARQMVMERLERLFVAHMPLAVGATTGVPDVRSGELTLKLINTMAEVLGVKRVAPTQTEINNTVNIITPDNLDQARAVVLQGLATEREKFDIVEGHLSAVGTGLDELTAAHEETDTMAPPPGVVPTQEGEAA